MRRRTRALATLVLLGLPTVLAFFSGGYFEGPRLVAGIAAWVLVGVAAVLTDRPLPRNAAGRAALAGLLLLAAWTALGSLWAPRGGPAQDDYQRLFLYVGFVLAGVVLLRDMPRRALEPALALGALIVVGYSLSERLVPSLLTFSGSKSAAGRLEQPLTYWNALGCLAAIGLVLCVRIAADGRQSRAVRAAGGAAGVVLGTGAYLTYSRGALAALAVGLLVLIALAPVTRKQARAAATLLAGAAAAALVASLLPAVNSIGSSPATATRDGLVMLCVLAAASAAVAFLTFRAPVDSAVPEISPASTRRRVLALAGILLVSGVSIIGFAALEGTPDAQSPRAGADARRLTSVDTDRYSYWRVAARSFVDDPVKGAGPSGFAVAWVAQPKSSGTPSDAHSLYLETLGELGLVGASFLALFLLGVAASGAAVVRTDRVAAAGPAAGFMAWAVAAGLDWHWEMPAVSLVALALAAALVAWGAAERRTVPSAKGLPNPDHAVPGGQLA